MNSIQALPVVWSNDSRRSRDVVGMYMYMWWVKHEAL